jgi:5'-phosphate synthase pdxT subunit
MKVRDSVFISQGLATLYGVKSANLQWLPLPHHIKFALSCFSFSRPPLATSCPPPSRAPAMPVETVTSKKTAVIGVLGEFFLLRIPPRSASDSRHTALQGAFSEHMQLLEKAAKQITSPYELSFNLVKTAEQLSQVSALIIPGGESTTMALIAERTNLLEPLREFVKVSRRPTWGTCAGMILLSESANRTKKGGQELIGGLDVRVNRNHFGRQVESFTAPLELKFLGQEETPFVGVFIRAPVVEALLPKTHKAEEEAHAPRKNPRGTVEKAFVNGAIEVLAELRRELPKAGVTKADRPMHDEDANMVEDTEREREQQGGDSRVVAVRQGNVVGTSFHPELTGDVRMHKWWLESVIEDLKFREELSGAV